MDSLGPPPHFDGTGFQRWKILMQSHLQAKGLNVWRVTSEGMKSKSQQERQYDTTAKCIILSSLNENVFNRVYSCENAHKLWKTIIENHEGMEDVANEDIMFSLIGLIALSNLMIKMPNLCTHV